jgi:hypothetical protein
MGGRVRGRARQVKAKLLSLKNGGTLCQDTELKGSKKGGRNSRMGNEIVSPSEFVY